MSAERSARLLAQLARRDSPFSSWYAYTNDPLKDRLVQTLASELNAYLAQKLPDYMVPSAYAVLDAFPLTQTGKVDWRALPDPKRAGSRREFVAPRTAEEQKLAQIWSQVLGVESVGANDSFFELGGHSLMAAQVVSRIREIFQVTLPLITLFEKPRLADLAEALVHWQQIPSNRQPTKITRVDRSAQGRPKEEAEADRLSEQEMGRLLDALLAEADLLE